jgi:hypothetical protein
VDNTVAQVQVQTALTELFKIRDGLKQREGLAPLVFNTVIGYVVRKVTVDRNATLQYSLTEIAGYANNV